MKSLLFLLVLGLITLTAAAQQNDKDYVVTTAGDTLRGRIQRAGKQYTTVRLYRNGMSPAEFSPAEVASFGDDSGPIGVSIVVGPKGKSQFLVPLVQGYVSLYSGSDESGKAIYFLQPADSAYVLEVPRTTARLTYLRVLQGCPSLDFAYSQTERKYPYTYTGITRLVSDYNACRQPQQATQIVNSAGAMRLHVGLKAGMNTSAFKSSGYQYTGQHQKASGYQAGFFLNFTTKTKWSAHMEATYLALRSAYGPTQIYNGNAAYITTRSSSVKYSQLQIPLLVRYTIGTQAIRPYLNAGPSYGINFGNRSVESVQNSNQPEPQNRPITLTGKASFGLAAGVGVVIYRPSLPAISLEARLDKMLDATGIYDTAPQHTSVRLDLGVAF